jgi:hypothetical protein
LPIGVLFETVLSVPFEARSLKLLGKPATHVAGCPAPPPLPAL